MNEAQLIRAQLAAEREHLREVAFWCAAARSAPAVRSRAGGSPTAVAWRSAEISQEFIMSCINYLLFFMKQEQARGAACLELSSRAPDSPRDAADPHTPPRLHGALAPLRAALAAVTTALAELGSTSEAYRPGRAGGPEILAQLCRCAALVERLTESRLALEALAERRYTVEDWRRVAHVDADSILEERKLRAEVLRHGAGAAVP